MDLTQISGLVSTLGFPIFVAGYMLMKQSKDTENMINILTKLENVIENLSNKMEGK